MLNFQKGAIGSRLRITPLESSNIRTGGAVPHKLIEVEPGITGADRDVAHGKVILTCSYLVYFHLFTAVYPVEPFSLLCLAEYIICFVANV